MFGKAKPTRPKRERTDNSLAQYGLFDVSLDNEVGDDVADNDSDLEAELLELSKGGGATKPKRAPPKKVVPTVDLDAMVAMSMKDIPSDEELSGDDDPDLLNELGEIAGDEPEEVQSTPVSPKHSPTDVTKLLEDRLKMYQTAEKNAKDAGETSRARRFTRGISTLKDLLKQAKAGKAINNDDIPPEVTVNTQKRQEVDTDANVVAPSRPAPSIPSPESELPSEEPELPSPTTSSPKTPSPDHQKLTPENEELLLLLNTRKNEYKMAALQAKKVEDSETAMRYIKTAKQFDAVIKAVEGGQPVDLSKMPGPPSQVQQQSEDPLPTVPLVQNEIQTESTDEPLPEPTLITASSVAEALQQRLEVYQKQEAAAKEQDNASKARRMGRIVKQFEDAIKLNKAGKPVPFEDLPNPPGYAPIPVEGGSPPKVPESTPKPTPVAVKPSPPPTQPSKSNAAQSRIDKQVALLIARQKEFKDAALIAKQKGEITQAKEFLRSSKGFDPLIDAARGGLPVDIATLPVPPSAKSHLDEEYEIIMGEEVSEVDPEHLDILSRLEQQLTKQLKMSLNTRDHNKAIGDVAGMNRFEQLALSVTRDLDLIRLAKKNHNVVMPKFHYETKDFSIVKCCTDLSDSDLELTIIRGLNYASGNSKDIDTYVKFEFPFPQEEPVRNKTGVIRGTNNPEYNETFILPIQRTSRPCQRVFKRHGLKLEIYSRGCTAREWACCFSGFFRGDTVIGTTLVKLQPLETLCELHESFDLVEGRKKIGGKLEIRLRLRDPIVTRQVEQLSEKWLVLDH